MAEYELYGVYSYTVFAEFRGTRRWVIWRKDAGVDWHLDSGDSASEDAAHLDAQWALAWYEKHK